MLFETIIAIGMIVSAVLAIYLKETIASVLSLSTLMLLLALLYFNLNAPLAAIFQLALGAGTAAIFLLAGDTLTTKRDETTPLKTKFLAIVASAVLCIPMLVGTVETGSVIESMEISLSQTIWDLRAIDVLAQGLVVLTAAIGVILLLREDRRRK